MCSLISLCFKPFKTSHYWSRDMVNFDFLNKGLGIVSPAHFVYDFSTKMFLMLYSINWPNFIVWLSLLLEILGNMCIAIVCWPGCDVINFKINLIFLIKPFLYMTKKSRQNLKFLKNEKSFQGEIKSIFHQLSDIVSDCHIKNCRWLSHKNMPISQNGGLFWKSLVPFFKRIHAFSVPFKMKPLRKSIFQS